MSFRVEWERKAQKELLALPKDTIHRIIASIDEIAADPYSKTIPLKGCRLRKIRVGDYRVLISIAGQTATIVMIGLRKNIYKRILGRFT